MRSKKLRKELIFITIAWDPEDALLRHTLDWINESRKHFERVCVYATRVNLQISRETSPDIDIHEIGGGNALKRLKGVVKLIVLSLRLLPKRKRYAVFYHMNVLPVLVMGVIVRLAGIPQGLWYSHKVAGLKLIVAEKLVNYCFSTSVNTFPLISTKVHEIGHGLGQSWEPKSDFSRRKNIILVVGRVSRVKRIEDIILANSRIMDKRPTIRLIGQIQDDKYLEEILTQAKNMKVAIEYAGELNRDELKSELAAGSIIYSGTKGSVDKAVLEGAISGCFLVSHNPSVYAASGQGEVLSKEFHVNLAERSLESQISFFLKIEGRVDIRKSISKLSREKNSLSNLMKLIAYYLNDER